MLIAPFATAIAAALKKIDEYYQKSASSDAHIMAIGILNYLDNILPTIYSITPCLTEDEIFSENLVSRTAMQSSRVCGNGCEFLLLYCFNALNILFRWLV